MAALSISPIAPARIGTLLLPVGPLTKSRFHSFVERLLPENVVRLGDITPDLQPDKTTFAPLAFPNGVLLFNFSTARAPEDHANISPYESFRESFVILGIADGEQNDSLRGASAETGDHSVEESLPHVSGNLAKLRQEFPRALSHHLLLFDAPPSRSEKRPSKGILYVPSLERSRSTTMKTVMCDVSALFLSDLVSLAKAVQAEESINSPGYNMTQSSSSAPSDRMNGLTPEEAARPTTSNSERPVSFPADGSLAPGSQLRLRSQSPANRPISPRKRSVEGADDFQRSFTDPANKSSKKGLGRRSSKDRRMGRSDSLNASDRAANRLRARQGVITGTLYLLAGRWADALRELVESTTRARVYNDHVWQAKGLENILVTMLLLSWARIEFTVPSICYASPEKAPTGRNLPTSSLVRTSESTDQTGNGQSRALISLSAIIPEMVHLILSIHNKPTLLQSEALPQFPYSECVIRLTYLLTTFYRFDSQLNPRALSFLILGSKSSKANVLAPKDAQMGFSSKREISSLLFKAFPAELLKSSMSLLDTVTILSGMATVLSLAGLHRKRALVMRDMLSLMVPRLIQARKIGAAELGIHPAASLAARHGLNVEAAPDSGDVGSESIEHGLHNLLLALCATYGVLGNTQPAGNDMVHLPSSIDENSTSLQTLHASLDDDLAARSFGGFALKSDILRLCANFSEALPNFRDVVFFTAVLLKTAGPGCSTTDLSRAEIPLPREEQMRFASKISRTLGVFKASEAARLECNYWDPFLVRSIELAEAAASQLMSSQKTSAPTLAADAPSKNPFIHNAFPQKEQAADARQTLIAGESTRLTVHLQNPYNFDLTAEKLQLRGRGIDFACKPHAAVLAPRCVTPVPIHITPAAPGELHISACAVKVQGFREQDFLIFPQRWKPTRDGKIKASGLAALPKPASSSLASEDSTESPVAAAAHADLKPATTTFRVVPAQPRLAILSTTLPQSTLTLFEGESAHFTLTARNLSPTVSANSLQLSFHGPPGTDPHRFMTWRHADPAPAIPPESTAEFVVDVDGRRGPTGGDVTTRVLYACAEASSTAPVARTVECAFALAVRRGLRVEHAAVVPGLGRALRQPWESDVPAVDAEGDAGDEEGDGGEDEDALLLDVKNAHHGVLTAVATLKRGEGRGRRVRQAVQPGERARLLVPVRAPASPDAGGDGGGAAALVERCVDVRWEDGEGRSGAVGVPGI